MHVALRRSLSFGHPPSSLHLARRPSTTSLLTSIGSFFNPQPQLDVDEMVMWSPSALDAPIQTWDCVTDNDYGGKSRCSVKSLTSSKTGEGVAVNYLRIEGKVDFDKQLAESTKVKGGFCALHGRCDPIVDLRDYEGLRITLRSPRAKQSFTVNLKSSSLFEDDIYQIRCDIKGGDVNGAWKTIKIPFSMFQLTARGMQRDRHRANDSLQVESLGFLFKEEDAASATENENENENESAGSVLLELKEIVAVERVHQ